PFGVMGGFMQPQGHVQVLSAMIDRALNPQTALDMPRWRWDEGLKVAFEAEADAKVVAALKERGHDIEENGAAAGFGRGQIIIKDEAGTLYAGTEKRCDGCVAAY
ncbi:MAG: gamma-glutamyltransferase family protein, partial [Firmicutes bacterium]|nr:gamma-glutamyltransferase family protein [Bacillota bacterium]